jgi:hypothetical protein
MKFLFTAIFLFVIACSAPRELPRLESISDEVEQGNKIVHAYIQLHKDEPNLISIWIWQKFDEFVIYRKNEAESNFEGIYSIDLKKSDRHSISRVVTVFRDSLNSSLESRYEIYPVLKSDLGEKLPVIYATSDTSYYQQLENKKLDQQNN